MAISISYIIANFNTRLVIGENFTSAKKLINLKARNQVPKKLY